MRSGNVGYPKPKLPHADAILKYSGAIQIQMEFVPQWSFDNCGNKEFQFNINQTMNQAYFIWSLTQ